MIRYAITADDALETVARNLAAGVEMIQIREKELPTRELMRLVRAALALPNPHGTKILVNSRADIALACGAGGVHLTSDAPPPSAFRPLLVGVSCHRIDEVRRAEREGAGFVVFGPVFEGKTAPVGLEGLAEACRAVRIPVLALGGVTEENAASCLAAGAGGIAGIRLFRIEPDHFRR